MKFEGKSNTDNYGATGSLLGSFEKHLDDIPGKHSSEKLQNMAILGTAHILRMILRYHFINFKRIFQMIPCNKPQEQGLTLAH